MAQLLAGAVLSVCSVAQNSDLNQAGFEALVTTVVNNVGNVGAFGNDQQVEAYNELSTVVTQNAKSVVNAGTPSIECARNPSDAGQIIMRTLSAPGDKNAYVLKFEHNDAPAGFTNTVQWLRGVITGPVYPNGTVTDWALEVYTASLNQVVLTVDPVAL